MSLDRICQALRQKLCCKLMNGMRTSKLVTQTPLQTFCLPAQEKSLQLVYAENDKQA